MGARTRAAWSPDSLGEVGRVVALAAAVLVSIALAAYALTFPQLTGRVVDEAGLFDPAAKAALEKKLADFETKTTGQLVVVTLKSLQGTSIEDYGYQLGRHWGVGQKEKSSGALLIVVPSERKVRIEVGYGLEGQLTDAVSKLIIENAIVPRFRAGDFAGGVNRGVDDIIHALNDPDEWRARARQRPDGQALGFDIVLVLLLVFVVMIIVRSIVQSQQPSATGRRGRRGRSVFAPVPWESRSNSSSGSNSSWWDSSSSSDSSWSGSSGGFSGGGGSFGGGGASGSW